MRKYVYIGLGGLLGAILRFALKNEVIFNYSGNLPLNTLIINVSGSFILGFFLTIAFAVWNVNEEVRLGVATGFLGAYTTFSALCKETVELLTMGNYFISVLYLLLSVLLGLAAAFFGITLAREVKRKLIRKKSGS